MSTSALVSRSSPARAWFREPYLLMVIGGPLVVVVASIVTVYLAISHPDQVLERSPAERAGVTQRADQSDEERRAAALSLMPASQARNHVVTPTLPTR